MGPQLLVTENITESIALEWTVFAVLGIAAVHLLAPYVHQFVERQGAWLDSMGRGMAVAYVFLHLFLEISKGTEALGRVIFVVVLFGFLLYYCVEDLSEKRMFRETSDASHAVHGFHFGLVIVLKWTYSWMIIFALPQSVREQGLHVIPAVIALCLHILHDDVELVDKFKNTYSQYGRFVLATAPVVAWSCDLYVFANNEILTYLLTAMLAGSILYTTFSGELEDHRKSNLPGFLVGVTLYVVLLLLADWN